MRRLGVLLTGFGAVQRQANKQFGAQDCKGRWSGATFIGICYHYVRKEWGIRLAKGWLHVGDALPHICNRPADYDNVGNSQNRDNAESQSQELQVPFGQNWLCHSPHAEQCLQLQMPGSLQCYLPPNCAVT